MNKTVVYGIYDLLNATIITVDNVGESLPGPEEMPDVYKLKTVLLNWFTRSGAVQHMGFLCGTAQAENKAYCFQVIELLVQKASDIYYIRRD